MKGGKWERRVTQFLFLVLAVLLTLSTSLPVADVPVAVSDNAVVWIVFSALSAVTAAWCYLGVSARRWWDCLIAFGLNLLTVIFLSRAIGDICMCYEYYLHGGG